jgi:hypothetical protein
MKPTYSPEHCAALDAYAAEHGRKWKARLIEAWLNDWREQWGTLRTIRNMYPMEMLQSYKPGAR